MSDHPVFLCDYVRTPFGRHGGALSGLRTDDLAAVPLAALAARNPGLDPAAIDEVILGCANQAGEDNRNVARMAALLAGLPVTVTGTTVNRLCGSGLDALAMAARMIRCGEADVILAGGVESMSRAPFVMPKPERAFPRSAELADTTVGWRLVNPRMQAMHGTDSMPETAENVAAEFGVSREDQDALALRSQERAARAMAAGRLAREIVATGVPSRKGATQFVDRDEHPRPDTTAGALAALPPIVRAGGTVTAGNAAGINDGAAALLAASEVAARRHGLTPLARILGASVAGVAPRIMGFGPAPATHKLLERLGMGIDHFDVIEVNEAFAAQVLAVTRDLGLPDDAAQVNPNGGAIALGHPLGASGARLAGTMALELAAKGGRRALATMCIGVGQGIAVAIERV
jgi:acetyl-CoA acyltransferase